MKYAILFATAILSVQSGFTREVHTLADVPVNKYTIVYSSENDPDEGMIPATYLHDLLKQLIGEENALKDISSHGKKPIIKIERPEAMPTFDYSINAGRGAVTIAGGSGWAMTKAIDELIGRMTRQKSVPAFRTEGSVEGMVLFERAEGSNLRILDDNIWDYSGDTLPQAWKDAGIDCRDAARAPKFAQLVRAYMPDVLTLQEYSKHMDAEFMPLIAKYGYRNACDSEGDMRNQTPVMYNDSTVELLEVNYNLYRPKQWSNHDSKSFTSAVFRHKDTGKKFAVINTHLWWKSDKAQPGSTQARAAQVRLMLAETEMLKAKHDCPIFVTGDMNCTESSVPMQQFLTSGYVPCYKAATVYGNTDNGHHKCGPGTVGTRDSHRQDMDRESAAIDHCLIYNGAGVEIKVFDCIQEYFTVTLTDHYPNLIDVRL